MENPYESPEPYQKEPHNKEQRFEDLNKGKQPSLVYELLLLVKQNKKWWLLPILGIMLLLGLLVFFASTGAAPFIYTLF